MRCFKILSILLLGVSALMFIQSVAHFPDGCYVIVVIPNAYTTSQLLENLVCSPEGICWSYGWASFRNSMFQSARCQDRAWIVTRDSKKVRLWKRKTLEFFLRGVSPRASKLFVYNPNACLLWSELEVDRFRITAKSLVTINTSPWQTIL